MAEASEAPEAPAPAPEPRASRPPGLGIRGALKSAENRASVPGIVAAEPFALAPPASFQNTPPADGPPRSGDIATTLAWYQRQTRSQRWSPNPTPTGETQGRHPVLMNMIPRSPPVQTLDGSGKARGAPAPVPDAYRCKLSGRVMRDPVVASDGHSYERERLEEWLGSGNVVSPTSREPLKHTAIYPNTALRDVIRDDPRATARFAALSVGAPDAPGAPSSMASPNRVSFADDSTRSAQSAQPERPARDPKRVGIVEWFVSRPHASGVGVVRPEEGGDPLFLDESQLHGAVVGSGDRLSYRVDARETMVLGGRRHCKAVDVDLLSSPASSASPSPSHAAQHAQARPSGARAAPGARASPPVSPSRRNVRLRGYCTWFSDQVKYGYLRPDDPNKADVFVHAAAAPNGRLDKDDRCEFRVATYNGRQRAVDVVLLCHGPEHAETAPRTTDGHGLWDSQSFFRGNAPEAPRSAPPRSEPAFFPPGPFKPPASFRVTPQQPALATPAFFPSAPAPARLVPLPAGGAPRVTPRSEDEYAGVPGNWPPESWPEGKSLPPTPRGW